MMAATKKRPARGLSEADLMKPSTATCSQCGSVVLHIPRKRPAKFRDNAEWYAWHVEAAKAVCPHCTPLPQDKWPEYFHGKLVKPCGCGSATCPVAAWAEQLGAA